MDLLKRLELLGETVSMRYSRLNYGGCCVYAALVARALKDHGIEARGIVASSMAKDRNTGKSKNLDPVRKKIAKNIPVEWNKNGVYFGHVGLEFKYRGRYRHYDSNGVKKPSTELGGFTLYKGRLTLEEMEALAASKDGWNSVFNREDIPAICGIVKEHLEVSETA